MKQKPKLWRWQPGRQGTGYEIFPIVMSEFLKVDCLLIRYPKGSKIPTHKDYADEGYEHHRLNILLKKCKSGGLFRWNSFDTEDECKGGKVLGFHWRYFRPDRFYHSVTEIKEGTRLVLSFGWWKKLGNS